MAQRIFSKVLNEPLAGVWSVSGSMDEHPGILYLNKNNLRLKLFLEVICIGPQEYRHPTLELMEPPFQPTIIGRTKRAGTVTLFRCAKSEWSAGLAPPGQPTRMELTLWPIQAWAGPAPIDDNDGKFTRLRFEAHGLHNILGTVHLEQVNNNKTGQKRNKTWLPSDAAVMGEYETVAWNGPEVTIYLKQKAFTIRLFTEISHAGSSYKGNILRTTDKCEIACDEASIEELNAVLFDFEQFLGLFCIGRFKADNISIQHNDWPSEYKLLWQMGRKIKTSKLKRLPHQVPLSLSKNPTIATEAIRKWFEASEQRKLARWLVFDTLSKSNTSTARYLALCQAWEILGREVVKADGLPADQFSAACAEVRTVLSKYLGQAVSERLGGLLGAANKPSLTKLIEALLESAPHKAIISICNDGIERFARDVSKVRNKLTHLENDRKLSIERASRMSIYLTFKLTALFCIIEMTSLGLPLDGLDSMMSNNKICSTARRPIPPK